MKVSTLMKDYLDKGLLKEQTVSRGFLPKSFVTQSDLPLQPVENKWVYVTDPERLLRSYKFDNSRQRSLFIEELMNAEEQHGHNAKITITANEVLVEVWTHSINTVTELDQEYASVCDELYNDVSLIGFDYEY